MRLDPLTFEWLLSVTFLGGATFGGIVLRIVLKETKETSVKKAYIWVAAIVTAVIAGIGVVISFALLNLVFGEDFKIHLATFLYGFFPSLIGFLLGFEVIGNNLVLKKT